MRIQLLVPANTPIVSPVILTQNLDFSHISRVRVRIPYGHAYLTGLQIVSNTGFPILPDQNSNTPWLVDDSADIESNLNATLDGPIYSITFRAYNLDDTFSHTFYLDIE